MINYVRRLVASNFGKNRENVEGELCFNVIIRFPSLPVVLLLHDVKKAVICVNQNERALVHVRGARSPWPPLATALSVAKKFSELT